MSEDLRKAELLKNTLTAISTQDELETGDYLELRTYFYSNPVLRNMLPNYVKRCRTQEDFWQFIKNKFQHYAERREYIVDTMAPLFSHIETALFQHSDVVVTTSFDKHGKEYIQECWNKALLRRASDPEGAITMSRTLIETVCKHILDGLSLQYKSNAELPDLYRMTAKELNLSPEDHQEQIFKQILSGCISVVNGIGSLRNKIGDAHGKSTRYVKPSERHASFVVNLGGSVAMFLLETYIKKQHQTTGKVG